jgi:hypothetical protein
MRESAGEEYSPPFIRWAGDTSPVARLLFLPEQILSVTSATREIAYEAGRDYQADLATGEIRLPAGSRIPFKAETDLYPPMTSDLPKMANRRGMPDVGILFGEGDFYHRLQAEVTYTCAPGQWRGYVPSFAGNRLPRTMRTLQRREPLRLLLVGDSISEGYNASRLSNAPPFCPPYGEQVAAGLERAYGGQVILEDHAVSGWSSAQGLEQIRSENLADRRPDLVTISVPRLPRRAGSAVWPGRCPGGHDRRVDGAAQAQDILGRDRQRR